MASSPPAEAPIATTVKGALSASFFGILLGLLFASMAVVLIGNTSSVECICSFGGEFVFMAKCC
jgi:uncharacterized membrane protein